MLRITDANGSQQPLYSRQSTVVWTAPLEVRAPPRRRATPPQRHPATAPPRRCATAPPRRLSCHLSCHLSRRLSSRSRARTAPCARPGLPHITPLPSGRTWPLPHPLTPAFVAGVGQRPLRFIKRGARWCAARQLSRKRRRQQIVWQGADTRGLWPLGRRRAGHDGRELRHAQWPRDQLAGRGKHAERVGLLTAAELATYDSRRPLLRTAAAWP